MLARPTTLRGRRSPSPAATKLAVEAARTSSMVSSPSARCSQPVNSYRIERSAVSSRYRDGALREVKICMLRLPVAYRTLTASLRISAAMSRWTISARTRPSR